VVSLKYRTRNEMLDRFTPSLSVQRVLAGSQRPTKPAGPDVIALDMGEADFATPAPIVSAAVDALHAGYTRYAGFRGDPELRECLAEAVTAIARDRYGADQIVVTHGATAAITAAVLAIANPGDRIVLPNPTYSMYADAAYIAGAIPVFVPTRADHHLNLDRLEEALRGARMLMICNPCNPTGAVYTRAELQRLSELIEQNGVIVFADEAYSQIVYDDRDFASMLSFPAIRSRIVYAQTFSKTYAMTGWRSGYVAGPREIIEAIALINMRCSFSLNSAVQRASLAAMRLGPSLSTPMIAEFARRRALMVEHARAIEGLDVRVPEGTFYLFARYDLDIPSLDLRERLLEAGVAVRSGLEFGPDGEQHLRLSFSVNPENITEGMRRMRTVFEQFTQHAPVRSS